MSVYKDFFESSHNIMCCSYGGKFRLLNNAWVKATGWTKEEGMEMDLADILHPEDVAVTTREITKLTNDPEHTTVSFVNRYKAKSGKWILIAWSAWASGDYIYAVGQDMTSVKGFRAGVSTQIDALNGLLRGMQESLRDE